MKYKDYLRSEHWRRLRYAKFYHHGYFCRGCGVHRDLQVHHLIYREPLESARISDLMVLCDPCHEIVHKDVNLKEWWSRTDDPNRRGGRILKALHRMSGLTSADYRKLKVAERKYLKASFGPKGRIGMDRRIETALGLKD